MLVVNISPPLLENAEVHTKTVVQVARDARFEDTFIDDESSVELLRRQFFESFVPGQYYHVRARYYLTPGGYQGWSNPYSFKAANVNELDIRMQPPVVAVPPTISVPYYDKYGVPLKDFKIALGIHESNLWKVKSVTWLIEGLDGTVVFSSVNDEKDINSIVVDKHLNINTPYIIRASIKTNSNSVSALSALTIKTFGIPNDFNVIRESIEYSSIGVPVRFSLRAGISFTEYELEVIDISHAIVYTEQHESLDIDIEDEVDNSLLYVRVRGVFIDNTTTGWVYIMRTPLSNFGFDYNLPLTLG